jgi:competence protein ComEC
MNFWSQVPFFRLLIPFVSGLVSALVLPESAAPHAVLFAMLMTALAGLAVHYYTHRSRHLSGALLCAALFASGYASVSLRSGYSSEHFGNIPGAGCYGVVLSEQPRKSLAGYKVCARVLYARDEHRWLSCEGSILLYFSAGDSLLAYGDRLLVSARADSIPPSQNPGEFDYRKYLSYRGIYHRSYVKPGAYKLIVHNTGNAVLRFALSVRKHLLELLSRNLSEQSYAVASALLIGYTGDLDPDLVTAFAHSGTLHVLSVSGMHVAVIYLVLSACLGFMDRSRLLKVLRVLILMGFLWMYALVTGFSPPVLRACVMLSLVIVGQVLNRNVNVYNILSASAFGLLLYNPFYIADVGFQLSYTALTGILLLQPFIYRQLYVKNFLADKAWQLTSTSIAAQVFAFPLGLLYFGQFPNYFVLTNLVVIPLSTLAIYGCIALLAVSFHPLPAFYVSMLCSKVIGWMNGLVLFFDRLPFAYLGNYGISVPEVVVMYAAIGFLTACCLLRKGRFLLYSLFFVMLSAGFQLYRSIEVSGQRSFTVYKIRGHTALELTDGSKSFFLADSSWRSSPSAFLFAVQGNRMNRRITETRYIPCDSTFKNQVLMKKEGFIQFYRLRILVAGKEWVPVKAGPSGIALDYLVVSAGFRGSISDICAAFSIRKVIADASVSRNLEKRIKEECRAAGIPFYSVHASGAFVEETD